MKKQIWGVTAFFAGLLVLVGSVVHAQPMHQQAGMMGNSQYMMHNTDHMMHHFNGLELSPHQRTRFESAVVAMVRIMQRTHIAMQQFVGMFDPFRAQHAHDQQRLRIIEAVKDATVDSYYGVEDFEECTVYFDGCNECFKAKGDYQMGCTEKACMEWDEPSCLSYDQQPEQVDDDNEPTSNLQGLCETEGGTWIPQHEECEYVSAEFCNENGGEFVECGSACRNDPLVDVCTMQCVPYCDFSDVDQEKDPKLAEHQAALDAAQELWDEQNIDTYTATQRLSCFCPQDYVRPISYQVMDGQVDIATAGYADDEGGQLGENYPELHTVDELFALIQEAIDTDADYMELTFDEQLGYPTEVMIDQSTQIADEEKYYTYEVDVK